MANTTETKVRHGKPDLVNAVASVTGLTKKDARASIDATFAAIKDYNEKGESVRLIGFGNFDVRQRAERNGRNPQTGESIKIAARKVPTFKAGKALKEAVNN